MFREDLEERISHRELVEWMIYDEYVYEMQKKEEGELKRMREKAINEKEMTEEERKAEARLDSDNLAEKLRDAEKKAGIH